MFFSWGFQFSPYLLGGSMFLAAMKTSDDVLLVFCFLMLGVSLGLFCIVTVSPYTLADIFMSRRVCRIIDERSDACVLSDAVGAGDSDAFYCEIIPRENWGQLMLQNAAQVGLMQLDWQRGELRYEADTMRIRLHAHAIHCVKFDVIPTYGDGMNLTAHGSACLTLRTNDGLVEWPLCPHSGRFRIETTKHRYAIARELQARIRRLVAEHGCNDDSIDVDRETNDAQ